jgi:hypothetical protein
MYVLHDIKDLNFLCEVVGYFLLGKCIIMNSATLIIRKSHTKQLFKIKVVVVNDDGVRLRF